MRDALQSLQHLVEIQTQRPPDRDEVHFAHARPPLGRGGVRDLPMPPLRVTVETLRELKKTSSLSFTMICIMTTLEYFTEQCRKVYFATEDFSHATFITANAGLFYLLQEKSSVLADKGEADLATEYHQHAELCRDNLETVLANLNLLISARRENVEALVLSSGYAIEVSKPSLAWQFNAAACQLCLTLGYHRASKTSRKHVEEAGENVKPSAGFFPGTMGTDDRRTDVLFWIAYTLDKALALRLGRSSILQDYDITLPRQIEPFQEFDEHRSIIQNWLVHAEVQGKTYEDLYSPRALTQPLRDRVQAARTCADKLLAEMDKLLSLQRQSDETERANDEGTAKLRALLIRSDQVAILSTLTLVYRAVPPGALDQPPGMSKTFCGECVDVARTTMRLHLECSSLMTGSPLRASVYMHWAILYSPFIPFIVLFCHAVESLDVSDVRWVEEFKISLEPWRGMSKHVERLFLLSEVLYNVASSYVEMKQGQDANMPPRESGGHVQQQHLLDASMSNEFDMYLTQLSLMPQGVSEPHADFEMGDGHIGQGDIQSASQVRDWFSGYMGIVGLSESSPCEFSVPKG